MSDNKYPLVIIEWEDSQLGFQGWKTLSEQTAAIAIVQSVGFVTHRDDKLVVLYPHIQSADQDGEVAGSGDITIPVTAIRSEKTLSISA